MLVTTLVTRVTQPLCVIGQLDGKQQELAQCHKLSDEKTTAVPTPGGPPSAANLSEAT